MNNLENLEKMVEKAELEVREKRILGGMELFNLKKQKYVIFTEEDYNKLLDSFRVEN